jgi:DNA-binding LytR/AlgR family response regulator
MEVTPMMSQDLPDVQPTLPSGTADQFSQAFPRPARAPVHRPEGRWRGKGSHASRLPVGLAALDRICLHDGEDYVLVPVRAILVARSDHGVTTVEVDGQSLRVRCPLRRLEATLGPFGFFRSHKAYLVNLRRVRRIVPWSRHVHHLLLDDAKETMVPLAKARRGDLRAALLWP